MPFPDGTDADNPPVADASTTDWEGYRAREKEWRLAMRAREVEIVVAEEDGYTRTLTTIDDLVELPTDQLPRVGLISIDLGGNGYTPTSARISVSRRDGLEVRVAGLRRIWTAGLRHELENMLRPSMRLRPRRLTGGDEFLMLLAVVVFFVVWFGTVLLFHLYAHWSPGAALPLSLLLAAFAAALPALILTLPQMEVLPG